MNVRPPENPVPAVEPCAPTAGYFDPPPFALGGPEGRLSPALRLMAQSKSSTTILTEAVVAQTQKHLNPLPGNPALAFADLAVTGRAAFTDFASKMPQVGGPIQAAAAARLGAIGTPGVTPALIQTATSEVLDRAYQVAWYLRAQTARGSLGWIAVSGEDDLPHRPVNVPGTMFQQYDLIFTVAATPVSAAIPVRTRFAIATATTPPPTPVTLPQRHLPPVPEPSLPPGDRIILFIHGSDSRLEEAETIIPKLVRTPDGRPSGYCVVTMDMPGSGYVNPIDHLEVANWNGLSNVGSSVLAFMESFVSSFVIALSSRLGQPGLVEQRIAAVMGGSLGGNLTLRLARRSARWRRNMVAFSPGSIWNKNSNALLLAGIAGGVPRVNEPENVDSRGTFFAGAFDQRIPVKTQPDQWFRDDWPCKPVTIQGARLDRRETYTPEYRRWHWRVSVEELAWTWQDPAVQDFKGRVLLSAGDFDDIEPAKIFSNSQGVAGHLGGVNGDTYFLRNTGHSMHAERPAALARKIAAFITVVRDHRRDDYDGDGLTDLAVWRPSDGTWHITNSSTSTTRSAQWGKKGDIPVPGDYDGDGKTDLAFWRPSDGTWHIISSRTHKKRVRQWGQKGDIPVPGDYDGDGKTDLAVWRPSEGNWYVIDSSTRKSRVQQWGQKGDIPVPGDYDGDRRTDFAVWRPSEGNWYVINSATGTMSVQQWGAKDDIPVPGNYDGPQYAVWRPSEGRWYTMDVFTMRQTSQQWGQMGDIPVPGDYDGDGRTDFAVWRPTEGNWYVIRSSDGAQTVRQFGKKGDVPLPR